jgi:hypothetical protein
MTRTDSQLALSQPATAKKGCLLASEKTWFGFSTSLQTNAQNGPSQKICIIPADEVQ